MAKKVVVFTVAVSGRVSHSRCAPSFAGALEVAMDDITPRFIFEHDFPKLIQARLDIAKRINAVIHFDVQGPRGGKWTVDCTKASEWISSGVRGIPRMTVSVADDDFVKIHTKALNPQVAGLTGRVRFKPLSLSLMTELGRLLF
jgi:hypothetical protein